MTWTVTNLLVQIITSILGAHAAAIASKEHSFGFFGHSLAGAIGGGLSGYFAQTYVATVVTAGGSLNDVTPADNAVVQGLTGLCAGAIVMLAVGFLKHGVDHRRADKM